MKNKNGIILWEGVSAIDGETPIVAIATGITRKTKNEKLSKKGSKVIQIWYLLQNTSPIDAVKTGEDRAVCGDCKHRPVNDNSCYVVTFQAPHAVWKSYHKGNYPTWDGDASIFAGRMVRFGAWGDPASVPSGLFDDIRKEAKKITAYTHQWNNDQFAELMAWAMASADTAAERLIAKAKGFRSFRVRQPGEPLQEGERQCPAADESKLNAVMDCETCGGCDGLLKGSKRPDYTLEAHGRGVSNFSK